MTSDREDRAETNKRINKEGSSNSVPDTITADSSRSATMHIESNWTKVTRHGPQQGKEDSPLSAICKSAFKGRAIPLCTRTNCGSIPAEAPTPRLMPPPIPQESDYEDPTSSFPYSDKEIEVDTDSDKENKPLKPICRTKICQQWIPCIRRAYQDYEDFKIVLQFLYLFNNEINCFYHVTFHNTTNPNLPSIFKMN